MLGKKSRKRIATVWRGAPEHLRPVADDVQDHEHDECDKVGVDVLVERREHGQQARGAEAVRHHVQQRAKGRLLVQLPRGDAIDRIQRVAEAVQEEEDPQARGVQGVGEREQSSRDAHVANQVRDVQGHGPRRYVNHFLPIAGQYI